MMLGNWSISVGQPLVADPDSADPAPLVWMSFRSLAGLGPFRRAIAILFRTAVITLIVLALAESRPCAQVRPADDDVRGRRVQQHPQRAAEGRARLRDRGLEEAAARTTWPAWWSSARDRGSRSPRLPASSTCWASRARSTRRTPTWARRVKLALATFPEDTARRIVFLSDGNENRGNLLEQALTAKSLGVQVDVLPIEYHYDREVLVEKVSIPPDVKKGETVNINVVIRASEPTRGTLQIFQKADNYRAPAAGNEKPAADRAPAWNQRLHAQAAHHRAEFLHVHGRVHSRARAAATAGRSTTSPRGSPTPGARPRCS